jgi:hypothetical protein
LSLSPRQAVWRACLRCPPFPHRNRDHSGQLFAFANIRSEEDIHGHVLNMQRKVPLPAMQWFRESRRHHYQCVPALQREEGMPDM